jgi:seryl-tRNA(Sec) selenium transferase
MFRDSSVQERLQLAVEHLATARHKITERVVDAYDRHLSALVAAEFPDKETQRAFTTIKEIVAEEEHKIQQRPGAYESILRNGLKTPIEIVRMKLDYRTGSKLAKMITDLYFAIESGIIDEYQNELDAARS